MYFDELCQLLDVPCRRDADGAQYAEFDNVLEALAFCELARAEGIRTHEPFGVWDESHTRVTGYVVYERRW